MRGMIHSHPVHFEATATARSLGHSVKIDVVREITPAPAACLPPCTGSGAVGQWRRRIAGPPQLGRISARKWDNDRQPVSKTTRSRPTGVLSCVPMTPSLTSGDIMGLYCAVSDAGAARLPGHRAAQSSFQSRAAESADKVKLTKRPDGHTAQLASLKDTV